MHVTTVEKKKEKYIFCQFSVVQPPTPLRLQYQNQGLGPIFTKIKVPIFVWYSHLYGQLSGRLWSPPTVLFNGHRGPFPRGKAAGV